MGELQTTTYQKQLKTIKNNWKPDKPLEADISDIATSADPLDCYFRHGTIPFFFLHATLCCFLCRPKATNNGSVQRRQERPKIRSEMHIFRHIFTPPGMSAASPAFERWKCVIWSGWWILEVIGDNSDLIWGKSQKIAENRINLGEIELNRKQIKLNRRNRTKSPKTVWSRLLTSPHPASRRTATCAY